MVSSSRTSAPAAKRQRTVEAASETVWYKNLIQSHHFLHSKHRAHTDALSSSPTKTKLTENGNFRLFSANGNGKRTLVFLGRQTDKR